MIIYKNREGCSLTISLEGRLDTESAPGLERELKDLLDGVTDLTFDFKKLGFVSSAGLRVMLSAQKKMKKRGTMKIINVNELVSEVFEVVGFKDFMTIE